MVWCTRDRHVSIRKKQKAPDKEALGSVLEELRTKDSILAIILFGSVARGQARPISDINLRIITGGDVPASEQIDLLSVWIGPD